MKSPLFPLLIPTFVITILSGLVYVAVQQDLRQGANDPQIQIAEDLASALSRGQPIASLTSSSPATDLAESLAPFFIVYDGSGTPLFSSGQLDGTTPKPPMGVFAYAKTHREHRVTWQPRPSVRIASVIVPFQTASTSGFILAGRSLREVERRESALATEVGVAWLTTMALTIVILLACIKKGSWKEIPL